jgi:hypothetical protein
MHLRQSIVAACQIQSVQPFLGKHTPIDDPSLLMNHPASALTLQSVRIFELPVSIPPLLSKLTFVPINRHKWGAAFQGGCVSVPESDYRLLLGQ